MRLVDSIAVEEALNEEKSLWVDLRTPEEYRMGSIPGAMNLPLFTHRERHTVGATYHQDPEEARFLGFNLALPKLPLYVDWIRDQSFEKAILYCFRGGMRSGSVAQVMEMMGLNVYQLEGGYKRFRSFILENLPKALSSIGEIVVIYGLTGAGKTDLIKIVKSLGHPALDLEDLAHHRGSAFGRIGIEKQQNQKNFEARLYLEMRKHINSPYLIVEAESSNIGQVTLPTILEEKMLKGRKILLQNSMKQRIDRIVMEYASIGMDFIPQALEALDRLKKRLGKERVSALQDLLREGQLEKVVGSLLREYYDPLYSKSIRNKEFVTILKGESMTSSARRLIAALHYIYNGDE